MKFRITLKDPDGVGEWLAEAADKDIPAGLDEVERDAVATIRIDRIANFIKKWIEDNEYLMVEFDTELGTATVVPVED